MLARRGEGLMKRRRRIARIRQRLATHAGRL